MDKGKDDRMSRFPPPMVSVQYMDTSDPRIAHDCLEIPIT